MAVTRLDVQSTERSAKHPPLPSDKIRRGEAGRQAVGAFSGATRRAAANTPLPGAAKCRRKFLRYFPEGFRDETYVEWERDYKWQAHLRWNEFLGREQQIDLIAAGKYGEFARRAVAIESRTNLLFSFEKMALRDAVRSPAGARVFAEGLHRFLYGRESPETSFSRWVDAIARLPRRQTRVLTWPLATVFGFIAQPTKHFFLKPVVTRTAAAAYGFPFDYVSRPNWQTYAQVLAFARQVGRDNADLRPRDMIDLQSFIWVQGSDEYD